MLVKNPYSRLGCGSSEDGLGIEDLKSHKFFEGIDFRSLPIQESPLIKLLNNVKRKQSMIDDWEDSDEEEYLPAESSKQEKQEEDKMN